MSYNSSYNPYTDEEDTSNNMFGVTNTNAANNLNNQFAFVPGSPKDRRIQSLDAQRGQALDMGLTFPNESEYQNLLQQDKEGVGAGKWKYSLPKDRYVDAGTVMNDASLFSHANAAPINNTELEKGMTFGNRYSADGLEFEGGVPRGQNTDDILYNMDKIIANNEFKEQPGIHFKNAPIENIFNRQNDPTKGFIDRNFRYRDLNKPEGINYDKRGFGLLGILQGLKNQFKINPEKQKEFDSWEENKNQKGWGYIGDTGLRGNIYEGPGGKKFSLVDPTTGYNVLQNKNWRGGTGNSLREQINLKNAWIADRLFRGKRLGKKADAYAKLNKLGTYADQETFTPPPGGGPLNEPGGEWVGGAPAYTHQGIGGGEYTNEIGNVEYQDPYDPGGGEAAGGLMRIHSRGRYSKGGRVGILAAF